MDKMSVAKMRMLWWMYEKHRKDKIINECFREHLGVAPINDKIRQTQLRWYGHVQRSPTIDTVRKVLPCMLMAHQGEGVRQRRRG